MTIPVYAILDRLIGKIEASPIDTIPADNIYMEDLFEPWLYKEILSRLPSKDAYDPLPHPDAKQPDGSFARLSLSLGEDTLERFQLEDRDFWQQMNEVFTSESLLKAIVRKFKTKLSERFGNEWPEMVTVPVFYRDFPGYFIRIHEDAIWKVATFQLYLPVDNSQRHLGTSFHIRGDGDQFLVHKTNDFNPNSGYAFVRTDDSWHSVAKIQPGEEERNSLALTIYFKGKEYKQPGRKSDPN